MWILKNVEGRSFYLLPGKKYSVGRQGPNTDLVLVDKSISRQHATLTVPERNRPVSTVKQLDTTSSLAVTILETSKCGTFLRSKDGAWTRIPQNEEKVLENGDCIRFGVDLAPKSSNVPSTNVWTLERLITTTSKLGVKETSILTDNMNFLGGLLVKAWADNCTHLTMSQITLTVKALCAMARGRPIVTPEFWQHYRRRLSANKDPPEPDYKEFIPPLGEVILQASRELFFVDERRKKLFQGKHFIFGTLKRCRELGPVVTCAGGVAMAYERCELSVEELCMPHNILINYHCNLSQESQTNLVQSFLDATDALKTKGRRAVPEQEIGYAILYCSINKYCNPDCDFGNSVLTNSNPSQSSRTMLDLSSMVLAYDTQEMQTPHQEQSNVQAAMNRVIPESGTSTTSIAAGNVTTNTNTSSGYWALGTSRTNKTALLSIKEERRLSTENTPSRVNNKKRLRDGNQDDIPVAKKPATLISPLGLVDNPISRRPDNSMPADDDDEDLFDFPSERKSRPSRGDEEDEDGGFEFPNVSRNNDERKRLTRIDETGDADLFATMESTARRPSLIGLEEEKEREEEEDMFRTVESEMSIKEEEPMGRPEKDPPTVSGETLAQSRSKRKMLTDANEARKPAKKKTLSFQSAAEGDSRKTSVPTSVMHSLNGFLNTTTCIKRDADEIADLSDAVMSSVIIEEKQLIVKSKGAKKPLQDLSLSSTNVVSAETNFKRFRKIPHVHNRIGLLPRIISGKDLYIHSGNIGDNWGSKQCHRPTTAMNEDDNDVNSEDDPDTNDWGFRAK